MAPDVPYREGAHEVGDGVWAHLQPDGGWGLSNAGLVASGDRTTSLLVDTCFDLELTGGMLPPCGVRPRRLGASPPW
jgi:cyclase